MQALAQPIAHLLNNSQQVGYTSHHHAKGQQLSLPRSSVEEFIRARLLYPHTTDAFYVADIAKVGWLYSQWMVELPYIRPFYAVKCNTDRRLLERLIDLGAGFDCASEEEMRLMLSLGASGADIIFANPCKQASHIKYAARNQVRRMTFDSVEELEKISRVYPDAEIVLRIATDDKDSVHPMSIKFGADLASLDHILDRIDQLRLNLIGVSFHVGSGCQDPATFSKAIADSREVFDRAKSRGHTMSLLDIGGGFSCAGLGISEVNRFSDIAQVIRTSIDTCFSDLMDRIEIISEPGRYFAAPVFTLATRVCSAKRMLNSHDMSYLINDGFFGSFSVTHIDHNNPNWRIIRPHLPLRQLTDITDAPAVGLSWLWGPTCAPIDIVAKNIPLPQLQEGDWIIFSDMGAYTLAIASKFNGFDIPKVYHI